MQGKAQEAQLQFERNARVPGTPEALANELGGKIELVQATCDPVSLALEQQVLMGTGHELATAQRALWNWRGKPTIIGLGLFLVLAVPSLWYFLLRRVREVADAVMGR